MTLSRFKRATWDYRPLISHPLLGDEGEESRKINSIPPDGNKDANVQFAFSVTSVGPMWSDSQMDRSTARCILPGGTFPACLRLCTGGPKNRATPLDPWSKHHGMKALRETEVKIHLILTSAINGR
jgi:hypothetical protein